MVHTDLKDPKKKFMFDLHNFDEEEQEEIPEEELEPPPPVFSEEELEAAKTAAFEEGRTQGLAESAQSRSQKVTELLERMTGDVNTLFADEIQRESLFEAEAVRLSMAIFEKLFPLYNEHKGFEELRQVMSDIIKKHEGQSQILIEVTPDMCEGIQSLVSKIPSYTQNEEPFKVQGNESLQDGACRLSWADGGATRDIQAIAEEIRSILQETLAGTPSNSHDEENTAPEPVQDQPLSEVPDQAEVAPVPDTSDSPDGTEVAGDKTPVEQDDMETDHDG